MGDDGEPDGEANDDGDQHGSLWAVKKAVVSGTDEQGKLCRSLGRSALNRMIRETGNMR